MKKLTVMVVDDEPVVADTILEILKEEGIDGFAFSSGHAALNWFSRINPDAVIDETGKVRIDEEVTPLVRLPERPLGVDGLRVGQVHVRYDDGVEHDHD